MQKRIQHYTYHPSQCLGKGYSSHVFKAIDSRNSTPVAIKVINLSTLRHRQQEQLLQREVRLLRECRHQNIVDCVEVFRSEKNCYIVTEYCSGGDLKMLLDRKGRQVVR